MQLKYSISNLFLIIFVFLPFGSCKQASSKEKLTIENLKNAYRNEIYASAQYAAFAEKARDDKYIQIKNLFNAVSKSESIHARNHKEVLDRLGIKVSEFKPDFELRTTTENLQISIEGEIRESTEIYIDFIAIADKEGVQDAKKSFEWAKVAEMKHSGYYTAALAAIGNNRINSLPDSFLVCPECGQTFEIRQVEDKCSSCRTPRVNFITFP